ncbi:hypothetical protein PHET_11522 [Paragonimus heterotremus]|uniref:Uncharacterized protein n=1 Tax=Paragonimus heterotremus TaxID=100268 RepID=A0A8J4T927_9TREM|nr:hypothetical protein PHET_11522 [Paragonimus heterotremus]
MQSNQAVALIEPLLTGAPGTKLFTMKAK